MSDHQYEPFKVLREEELRAAALTAQSADNWTLAQAAAWVMFRDISIVARFTAPHADQWLAYLMYPKDWTKGPVLEKWHDLFRKLKAGRLASTGRRSSDGARETIPAANWADLVPDVDAGPYVSDGAGRRVCPWTDILVHRADVERLWRRPSEVNGRSKFDRTMFQNLFLEQRSRDPELSANEIIKKVSHDFEQRTKQEAPSFSTFKRYVTDL